MSIEAIKWALNEAPLSKASHLAVLMALANVANEEGKGAFISQRTMSWQTRKTERAVRNDLKALEDDGVIRRGNQERVSWIPADRRPIVWDLALERTRDMSKQPNKQPASGWDGKHRATDDVDRIEPGGSTLPPATEPQVKPGGSTLPPGSTTSNRGEVQRRTGGKHTSDNPNTNPNNDTHPRAHEADNATDPKTETRVCEFSDQEINQMKTIIYAAVVERATGAVEDASHAQLYDLLDHAQQCWALNINTDTIEDALNRRINDKTQYPYRVAREQLKTLINRTKEPAFLPPGARGKKGSTKNPWVDKDGFEWPHHEPYARACGGQSCSDYGGKRYVAFDEHRHSIEGEEIGPLGRVIPAGEAFSCPVCRKAYKKEVMPASR